MIISVLIIILIDNINIPIHLITKILLLSKSERIKCKLNKPRACGCKIPLQPMAYYLFLLLLVFVLLLVLMIIKMIITIIMALDKQ